MNKKSTLCLTVSMLILVFSTPLLGQQPRNQSPPAKDGLEQAARPELVVQNGHSDNVRAVAFSPDGRVLASSSSDKTIRLWEVATGRLLRVLDHHRDNVTSIAFSPDGTAIVSGSLDKDAMVSDIKTGRLLRTLSDHKDEVNAVAFSSDGRLIATGSRDESINIWDTATGKVIVRIGDIASDVRAVAFSPDAKLLVSGSVDKVVRLWRVSDGSLVRAFGGHLATIRAVAFSPDGQTIASGGDDKTIKLWSLKEGLPVRSLEGHLGTVTSLVFTRNGKSLLSGSQDKTIRVWDVHSGKPSRSIEGATSPISSIALSPDEKTLAAGSWMEVHLLDSSTGRPIRSLQGRLSWVNAVAFSPDGKMAAYATWNSIKLWDSSIGGLVSSLDGHTSRVNSIAFSPKGKIIASGSSDKTVKLWDLTSNRLLRSLEGHISAVSAVAFSPDGKHIASGSIDRTVRLWNVESGQMVRVMEGHVSLISALAFSPGGKLIASAGYDNSIRLWDVASGRTVHTLSGYSSDVTGIAFSPDGAVLAASSRDKTVRLWSARTGQLIRALQNHPSDVLSVAFSPDGKVIASGDYDKTILLSDAQTGKVIGSLKDHSGPVIALAYSPDGRFIMSGSEDATAKIWSPGSAQPLSTLLAFADGREWLVVSPEGLFDGSPEGWKSILWRFAASTFDVVPVEAFFNEFYYPGLLAEILKGRQPKSAQVISQLDRRQPRVKLALADASLSADRAIDSRQVRIRVEVTEAPPDEKHRSGSGARDVRLFRNGSLIKVWRGDVLKSGSSVTLEETVTLVAGENHLTAYAFNRDNIKSADESLLLIGSEKLRRKGTTYVLTVGINEYANPEYNLKYAVADAETFSSTVRQAQSRVGISSRVEVITLLDKDATRANILAALDKMKATQPEDTVMVYFAGHGLAQKDRFYLIPHDHGYKGPAAGLSEAGLKVLLEHSISDRELEKSFEQIGAGGLLMVIDACHSGQALESEEARRGPMNSKGLAQLAYEKGMYILTAAQGYQAALEAAELGHGFLTYALVEEGLKKAAADIWPKDQTIVVREWLDYAAERVPQMQIETLQGARGLKIAFVQGEEKISDPEKRNVQRPRVFYRREMISQPLIIEKLPSR